MAITYRDIEVAPLPKTEPKERKPRKSKYPLDGIPVGGARAFPMDGKTAKSAYSALYVTASRLRKANPNFQFKVVVHEDKGEVWVHRLAKGSDGGVPAASETVTNGDYDYERVAAE